MKQAHPNVQPMCASRENLEGRNENKLSAGKKSLEIIYSLISERCAFHQPAVVFYQHRHQCLWYVGKNIEKNHCFCCFCINYHNLFPLMFVVFCKCKDCVLITSSIFHIKLCKLRFCSDCCWQQAFVLCKQFHNYWNFTSWLCYIWRDAYWSEVLLGETTHQILNV